MMVNVLLYTVAVFVALGLIALLVASIMGILYALVHRKGKKEPATGPSSES